MRTLKYGSRFVADNCRVAKRWEIVFDGSCSDVLWSACDGAAAAVRPQLVTTRQLDARGKVCRPSVVTSI
jgi:hypothetical protein